MSRAFTQLDKNWCSRLVGREEPWKTHSPSTDPEGGSL